MVSRFFIRLNCQLIGDISKTGHIALTASLAASPCTLLMKRCLAWLFEIFLIAWWRRSDLARGGELGCMAVNLLHFSVIADTEPKSRLRCLGV